MKGYPYVTQIVECWSCWVPIIQPRVLAQAIKKCLYWYLCILYCQCCIITDLNPYKITKRQTRQTFAAPVKNIYSDKNKQKRKRPINHALSILSCLKTREQKYHHRHRTRINPSYKKRYINYDIINENQKTNVGGYLISPFE